jgi:hypothetical protein
MNRHTVFRNLDLFPFSLLVTANVVPNSQILSIQNMEAKFSSKMSALTRPTLRHIPEDDILHGSLTVVR